MLGNLGEKSLLLSGIYRPVRWMSKTFLDAMRNVVKGSAALSGMNNEESVLVLFS